MRFSIIVPVYNVEKYLSRCMESILRQSYEDYEIILIDDGSTDESGEICDAYARRDARIQIIHQENYGLSGARNTGLNVARGDWIVFVDSDDWIETEMLERLDAQINKAPADMYRFNMCKIDENGRVIERLLYSVEYSDVFFRTEQDKFNFYLHRFMQYKMGWEVCGGIYRRKLVEKHGIRFVKTQEVFAEDYLFTFQYLLYVQKVRLLCEIFYNYVERSDSLMNTLQMDTVMPRLMKWGEYGYLYVKNEKLKFFIKNYEQLYFMLINYHVQYMLCAQPIEDIRACLRGESCTRKHKKWMKKLAKTKERWMKYMGTRIWL